MKAWRLFAVALLAFGAQAAEDVDAGKAAATPPAQVMARKKPPKLTPTVEWSNYDPAFVFDSYDAQAMQINFKGKFAVTGMLVIGLGGGRVSAAYLVPDPPYLEHLPQVVDGFKPMPLQFIELSPVEAISAAALQTTDLATVSNGGYRMVKQPVRVVLRNLSTYVECDWRYYAATVDPADVMPLTLTVARETPPVSGC